MQGNSRKTSTSASLPYAKAFDCVDHNKLWKILKEMRMPDYFSCFLGNLYAGQEAEVNIGHGTLTGSQLGKEYVKAVYCHPVYLTYMQSTSCKLPDWMKPKLESRLGKKVNNLSYADNTTLMTESKEELKRLFMKVKEESEKSGLKFNTQ